MRTYLMLVAWLLSSGFCFEALNPKGNAHKILVITVTPILVPFVLGRMLAAWIETQL